MMKMAGAAAMATATAIATTAMASNGNVGGCSTSCERAFKDVRLLGGGDDLSPLLWFLRSALCALCTMPALGKSAFPTMDRLRPM